MGASISFIAVSPAPTFSASSMCDLQDADRAALLRLAHDMHLAGLAVELVSVRRSLPLTSTMGSAFTPLTQPLASFGQRLWL
jgi:hypothetical protein